MRCSLRVLFSRSRAAARGVRVLAAGLAVAVGAGLAGIGTMGPADATSLDGLRGSSRPLVVFAPAPDFQRLKDQLALLRPVEKDLRARDLVVLTITAADDPLRLQLGAPKDGFLVVLVGKDGAVAARWTAPVDPWAVFGLIDRAPLRREETKPDGLRRQGG